MNDYEEYFAVESTDMTAPHLTLNNLTREAIKPIIFKEPKFTITYKDFVETLTYFWWGLNAKS